MAEENRAWGYRRIQAALGNLGHLSVHNTIANILKVVGILRDSGWTILQSGSFNVDFLSRAVAG
jgi:hypothetical protein